MPILIEENQREWKAEPREDTAPRYGNLSPTLWRSVESLYDVQLVLSGQDSDPIQYFWFCSQPSKTYDCPVALTATLLPDSNWAIILFTLDGCYSVTVAEKQIAASGLSKLFGGPRVSVKKALGIVYQSMVENLDHYDKQPGFRSSQLRLRRIKKTEPYLKTLEEFRRQEYSHMHVAKVGVLYQAKGQTDEDALYCNSTGSSDYECFLKWLGDRVQLTGYTGYRGGLDVKKGNTGSETIVARFTLEAEPSSGLAVAPLPPDTKLGDGAYKNSDGAVGRHSEIMFHVSTLLPTSKTDEQQLNKKCHIGNDNIVIIFSESADCQVTARTMKSKMLMMVINVWPAAIYSPDTPPESRRFCFQAMLRRGLDASKPYFSSAPEGLPLDDKLHRFFIEKLLLARLGYWQVPELNVKLQHMRRDGLQRIANMIAGKPLY